MSKNGIKVNLFVGIGQSKLPKQKLNYSSSFSYFNKNRLTNNVENHKIKHKIVSRLLLKENFLFFIPFSIAKLKKVNID